MPWATLRKIVFFCCEESDEIQDAYDESSHLIPAESVESPMIYSNVVLIDHQQLQERLGMIVRTKEGKMVNVASQIPFNLHNKVLPPEQRSYGSVSRSASRSTDQQFSRDHDHDYQTDYGYSNHDIHPRQRHFYVSAYDDVGPSSSHPRYLSHTLDHHMPTTTTTTPILNVRLVGYTDNMSKTRGRARERRSQSTDILDPTTHETARVSEGEGMATAVGNTETSCDGLIADTSFKLHDVGSITLNWND